MADDDVSPSAASVISSSEKIIIVRCREIILRACFAAERFAVTVRIAHPVLAAAPPGPPDMGPAGERPFGHGAHVLVLRPEPAEIEAVAHKERRSGHLAGIAVDDCDAR